jgi:hypothetical protein
MNWPNKLECLCLASLSSRVWNLWVRPRSALSGLTHKHFTKPENHSSSFGLFVCYKEIFFLTLELYFFPGKRKCQVRYWFIYFLPQNVQNFFGATTLCTATLSIMAFGIIWLNRNTQYSATSSWMSLFIVLLNAIMMSVIRLNVVASFSSPPSSNYGTHVRSKYGTTTFSITSLTIITFSIMTFSIQHIDNKY